MSNVKNTLKKIGRQAWELFKGSFPSLLMYFCAGSVLMMITMKGDNAFQWNNTKLTWTLVCIIVAGGYNALVTYAQGGNAYEMLVSGNMKRVSAEKYGEGYKISSHKEAKEYRAWKGFVMGGYAALFPIIVGIVFGCKADIINQGLNQETTGLSTGFGIFVIISFLLSGWSILPLFYLNASGHAVSYFLSCVFGIIPIAVTGAMYIVGAYGKRNKNLRKQALADQIAQAQETKEKKINYGGLPGTKPKKRK